MGSCVSLNKTFLGDRGLSSTCDCETRVAAGAKRVYLHSHYLDALIYASRADLINFWHLRRVGRGVGVELHKGFSIIFIYMLNLARWKVCVS